MIKWEYKVVELLSSEKMTSESLSILGEQGWEGFASYYPHNYYGPFVIMKRPKEDQK